MARLSRCATAQALLSRRLDETLPPVEAERLERHLAECPACQERHAQLLALRAALHRLPIPDDSPAARDRTLARFDARLRQTPRRVTVLAQPSVRLAVAVAAAAASLLIPLQPVDAPLPDPGEISALHALHAAQASVLPGLPDGASAEANPEAK